MIHRLVTTPMSSDDATTELNEIKTIAKVNGYSEEFVDRIHNKHKKKEELRNLTTLIPVLKRDDASTKTYASTFTNYKRFSGTIKLIWCIATRANSKTEMLQKSGIYQVECEGCDFVYIGQTKRSLKPRCF
jgi:hypothetical protein